MDKQPSSLDNKPSNAIIEDQAGPLSPPKDDVSGENEAATKIQAVVRGKKARDEVKALKAEKQETEKEESNDLKEEVEQDPGCDIVTNLNQEETEELAAAAVKIQASFRGMKARKQVESKKEEIDENEDIKP